VKAAQALWRGRDVAGQELEGDISPDRGVASAIHLTHAADAKQPEDFVAANFPTDPRRPDVLRHVLGDGLGSMPILAPALTFGGPA
jgi:hypothetical protein